MKHLIIILFLTLVLLINVNAQETKLFRLPNLFDFNNISKKQNYNCDDFYKLMVQIKNQKQELNKDELDRKKSLLSKLYSQKCSNNNNSGSPIFSNK